MEDGLDVPEVSSGLNIFFFFFLSYLPTGELRGNYFHDKEIFHRFFFFFLTGSPPRTAELAIC